MTEALQYFLRNNLPEELSTLLSERLAQLQEGKFLDILQCLEAQRLFSKTPCPELEDLIFSDSTKWDERILDRLGRVFQECNADAYTVNLYFIIAYAALLAFLQSNVTGPPLPFLSAQVVLPDGISKNAEETKARMIASLSIDGIAAYKLTPNVELLCLAKAIFSHPTVLEIVPVARWARLRTSFIQQRVLSEPSPTLQHEIYQDLGFLYEQFFSVNQRSAPKVKEAYVQYLLERASIETFHGSDKRAKADLNEAAQEQDFLFAVTGLLGRRTKFQQHDVSQLVVLARSTDCEIATNKEKSLEKTTTQQEASSAPKKLDLNDDTLLESISFTENPADTIDVQDYAHLPPALKELDPSKQPQLKPLDSIILLALASSITNTSPADGITREETLPYAVRVLEGGSSNWQVYTQALLVRSRMEGYRSRTVERGLLQLQALVDQVIADTSSSEGVTSFLPKEDESTSAPVSDRLRYIFQLAAPSRWELEAELAKRWVALGGLRSALEIYERLEMWAEAALCYAATEKEETAKRLVRRQLYHSTTGVRDADVDPEEETWQGIERSPPSIDAPRLYCILGDIDSDPVMYEKAWIVSDNRYARAQRSLGRLYFAQRDHARAADAYAKSLRVNALSHPSWFALGCSLLELSQFDKAAEAFSRCTALDETDAEAWSNLAAALLKNEVPSQIDPTEAAPRLAEDDDETVVEAVKEGKKIDPQQRRKEALRALKRAASLKHDSYRIWENLLIIAASVSPIDYSTVLTAQRHIIDLRGKTDGERCIDVEIMELLVRHMIAVNDTYDPSKPGFERLLVEMMDKQVVPLITASRPLWQLVAKLALWRGKPATALEANEKSWRAVTTQPGWETENERRWNEVVEATIELCDAYESLGPREKTEGMAAGSGQLVAKDWKFKSRTAVRGILGRGKDSWEGTNGWEELQGKMDELRS